MSVAEVTWSYGRHRVRGEVSVQLTDVKVSQETRAVDFAEVTTLVMSRDDADKLGAVLARKQLDAMAEELRLTKADLASASRTVRELRANPTLRTASSDAVLASVRSRRDEWRHKAEEAQKRADEHRAQAYELAGEVEALKKDRDSWKELYHNEYTHTSTLRGIIREASRVVGVDIREDVVGAWRGDNLKRVVEAVKRQKNELDLVRFALPVVPANVPKVTVHVAGTSWSPEHRAEAQPTSVDELRATIVRQANEITALKEGSA